MFPPCTEEQGEEVGSPSADQHLSSKPYGLLLVMQSLFSENNKSYYINIFFFSKIAFYSIFFFSPSGKKLDIKKSSYKKV